MAVYTISYAGKRGGWHFYSDALPAKPQFTATEERRISENIRRKGRQLTQDVEGTSYQGVAHPTLMNEYAKPLVRCDGDSAISAKLKAKEAGKTSLRHLLCSEISPASFSQGIAIYC